MSNAHGTPGREVGPSLSVSASWSELLHLCSDRTFEPSEQRTQLPKCETGENRRACKVDPAAPTRVEAFTQSAHQTGKEQPPERRANQHPQHHRAGCIYSASSCQGSKYGDEREDGRRVGQRKYKCGREVLPVAACWRRCCGMVGCLSAHQAPGHPKQECGAEQCQRYACCDQCSDQPADAIRSNGTVHHVGASRTKPSGEPGARAVLKSTLDREQPYGADWRCDRQANQ